MCKPIFNNIYIDDCKEYLLNGLSYKQYCENILKIQMSTNEAKMSQNQKIMSQNKPKFKCEFCEKEYKHIQSLNKHLKKCEEKKKDDTVKESMTELVNLLNEELSEIREQHQKEMEKRDKEMEKRDKQIEELIKKAGINTTNNNITNVQNNIKLLNYKDTDTSDLTENDYVKCLEHYNFCVPHLIRRIHFNPKKPENHNVYISNLKNSYVMVYANDKWKVKNRDETITELIDDKQVLLEQKIQEWVKEGNKYPRIMAKFSRYIEKRENSKVLNAIKEDIKLTLYNNRNMIIENNKLLENK
tara:strand:- start:270 stop:1169 length:900 start_codon:yes stop_codon:yes gene_type:complete